MLGQSRSWVLCGKMIRHESDIDKEAWGAGGQKQDKKDCMA
jgi:hypothetical protein